MSELRHLHGQDCANLLARLRAVLHAMGVELESLPLWQDLADIRWLTSFNCDVLRERGGPGEVDAARTAAGFVAATFVNRSVKAISRCASLPGFEHKIRHLRNWRLPGGGRDRSEQSKQARDHLYEIEVAARLGYTFSDLRFSEPDLLARDSESDFTFAIACKRPRSATGLMRSAKRAVAQVRQSDVFGAVFLSADNLVDPVVRDVSGRSLLPECQRRITRVIDATSGDILRSLSGHPPKRASSSKGTRVSGVLGVIVSSSFLLLGRDGEHGPAFLNTGFVPAMINRNKPEWARGALAMLLQVLQAGENELVAEA